MSETSVRKIQHTWVTGRNAATMIIAKELAVKYGLTNPSHIILEERPDGILIRKLSTEELAVGGSSNK